MNGHLKSSVNFKVKTVKKLKMNFYVNILNQLISKNKEIFYHLYITYLNSTHAELNLKFNFLNL